MTDPQVSVIITTYHNERYLPRAIDSVLGQTYPNIQLIVVDDNPPDSPERRATEDVMARYPQALYLRHPENRNGAAARNTGLRAATGKYIAFLDNDDFYFSHHIASCVQALRGHPDCGSVVTSVVKICGGICWERIDPPTEEVWRALLMKETALGTGSNLFLTADTARQIQGFDERFRRHQDVEFGLRYFALDRCCPLEDVQIVKEMDGFSNVPALDGFLATKQLLWDTFRNTLDALSEADRHRYFAAQYSSLLYTACRSGRRDQIQAMRRALEDHRPLSRKEKLLVALTNMGLFRTYEALKRLVKRLGAGASYRKIAQSLPPRDRASLDQALSAGRKEAL
ncbi:MAG: glycosyltransferase family 2 protein [Oscillospiraceae bacterium]|nr:glycosyltransferase family 2 protein [Oscillospiraceae bacterium]